ncbi:MAG TPA: T9SS type A sorting domain-containing protein [Puia sp.]|nr:T9SS type A sorting domain-containing protein [Puia sp.]
MKPIYIVLTTFSSFCLLSVSAQSYYPGGLGNGNLVIWLNANKSTSITQNGANKVSQWSDLSGNGYSFVQATAANAPVYGATTGPNSRPALTFASTSSQYLSTPTLPASISYTGGTSSFSVASFSASQTAQGWQRIYDFGNGQASNNILFGRDGSSANFAYESWNGGSGDQTYTSNNPIVNGSNNIYEAVQQAGTVGSTSAVSHYMGGATMTSTGAAGSSITWVPTAVNRTSNFIGRSNWAADNYFSGTMSEILFYKASMNTTQRTILENYFSAEWGLTVSVSKFTPPTTTTYGTNLVGIGYTNAADSFLTDVAGSTDGLGFSSSSGATGFLNAAGYLMAAHNGQANTILNNTTVTGISTTSGAIGRWNRSWDLQKTGGNSTGLVTVNFNASDYNGTAPTGTYTYGLLYNATDGSFASGTNKLVTTTSTSIAGNTVSFVVNATNLSNGYYALIWSTTGVLPIVLSSFEATKQTGNGLLEWNTAQETGSARFEIQRGTDGLQFTTIGTVAAKGNSLVPSQYNFTDKNPVAGINYYRLKMIDLDGNSTYSAIKSIDFGTNAQVTLTSYPNPVTDGLHITVANASGEIGILITNSMGQAVRTLKAGSGTTLDIPMNDLAKGVYVIVVSTGTTRLAEKILKN